MSKHKCGLCDTKHDYPDDPNGCYEYVASENEYLKERVAELEASRRWIPVSERLPEDGVYVLCNIKDDDNEYQAIQSCFAGVFDVTPTHWMPLPEAPGAENG